MNDKELIEKIQQGESKYFTILHNRYEDKVRNRVRRFVYNESDVEEVTQNVWIKVHRSLKDFKQQSTFYTYVYRIATNEAFNFLTHSSRRIPSSYKDPEEDNRRDSVVPEDEIFAAEIAEILDRSIKELPDDLKEAIVLRDIHGLSYQQIADQTGCRIGTVKSRIYRARDLVDEQLSPHVRRPRIE